MKIIPNLSRLSLNLWNSAVAIMTVGMLFRGIVNLSGRSTTLDMPYWYVGAAFAALALLSMVFTRSEWKAEEQAQPVRGGTNAARPPPQTPPRSAPNTANPPNGT